MTKIIKAAKNDGKSLSRAYCGRMFQLLLSLFMLC